MTAKAAKAAFFLVWLAIFIGILTDSAIKGELFEFLKNHKYAAPLLLIAIQAGLAALALPCSPVTVLAGLLWGVGIGLLYSILATLVASILTFLLGRYVFRDWLRGKMQEGWRQRVLVMIDRLGWKASALAHANPIFPGSSLGYCFGASSIPFPAFWIGALVGNLPLQILMVKVGDVARDIADGGASTGVVIVILLLVVSIVLYRVLAPMILDVRGPDEEK